MTHNIDDMTRENDGAPPVIDGGGFDDTDWQTAAAEQERRRRDEETTARMNENRADLAQYDEMLGAQRAQAAQRRANGLRQTAIAMRYAMQNGGRVPEQLIPAFNQKMGYDGKTRRFLGGMYDGKGNLHFFMQNGDGQGNFQDAPVTLDRKGQFDLMREFPGIFSDEDVDAMAQSLMTKDGLTRDQIWGGNAMPGSRTASGGTVVNPSWLTGPQRRSSISAFGADGRGGFTQYESSADTGYQLQQRDFGARAAENKGRWKVLSRGADPNSDDGTQITRYENDKTGEVVSVRDGETPPWESRAGSEKERIARINADGKIKAAEKANETKTNLAEAANALKQYGIDVSAQLKERGLDIQQQNADERSAHNRATEGQQAENEKGRRDRAKQANETKTKLAEIKGGGTIGGRQPTAHEYVEVMKLAGDLLQSEETRGQARELGSLIADQLKKRGEKVPEVTQSGKAEVKTGDNGSGNERQDANDDGLPDNAQSRRYPGFRVATVKKALANGYVYDKKKGGFVKPKR